MALGFHTRNIWSPLRSDTGKLYRLMEKVLRLNASLDTGYLQMASFMGIIFEITRIHQYSNGYCRSPIVRQSKLENFAPGHGVPARHF